MNEKNPNTNNNNSKNSQQSFDYQAHYRKQNQHYKNSGNPNNSQYSNQQNNSQYSNEQNNSQHYQNTQNQPPKQPTPPNRHYSSQNYSNMDSTKAFCILSYISILWVVGLLADKDNPKVRFHVNQGIILTIFEVILNVLVSVLQHFISIVLIGPFTKMFIISHFGMMLNGILSFIVWCFYVAFMIIGIIHAVQDRQEPLPIIGTAFQILK